MKFQILDADYTYDDLGSPVIRLYGKNEAGQSICCFVPGFKPYFFLKPDNPGKAGELAENIKATFTEHVTDVQLTERYEPVGYFNKPTTMLKLILKDPKGVPAIRDDILQMNGVSEIYETDILFRNRFMIDSGIGGMSWVETDSNPLEGDKFNGISLFEVESQVKIVADTVTPVDIIPNSQLKYMAFDIECLPIDGGMPVPEKAPIVMISCTFEPQFNGSNTTVLLSKKAEGLDSDTESFPDEVEMLERFFRIIREYDPDMFVGYNSNSFDIPYIVDRVKTLEAGRKIKIKSAMGRDGRSVFYRKIGYVTKIYMAGRVAVDVLPIIRRDFSLKQYTLKNTARELLDKEKLDVNPADMEEYWNDTGEKFRKFIDYARRDAELAMDLLQQLSLLDRFMALSRVSGTLIQDILDGGQTNMVENILLREYRSHNRVMAPRPDSDLAHQRRVKSEELKGGEVLEPKKGLLEDVVILDYKSLYPTIMMAHNLCYTTEIIGDVPDGDVVVTPSGGKYVSSDVQRGIVPTILEGLLNQRIETKQRMKDASGDEARVLDATQHALKILLNSYYGYSGYTRAKLYSLTLANSVTSFGRENILNTKQVVEGQIGSIYIINYQAYLDTELAEKGLDRDMARKVDLLVVYGDTDSVFVKLSPEGISLDDAGAVGRKISGIVSDTLPDPMELEFESFSRRSIFIAKKRYAVWVFEPGEKGWSDSIKVKGMETVRRDWCELTSKTLNHVLELVLKEGRVEEAVTYVRQVISSVRNIDIAAEPSAINDLVLTRKYTKKTESYRNKQPHVTVVEKMRKRLRFVPSIGDRIPFVITAGSGLFVERAEDPEYVKENNIALDVDYYVKKQILPPVERILRELGVDASVLDYDEKQKGLADFGGGLEAGHTGNKARKSKTTEKKGQARLFDF
jgi:DNA polymerase I